jgi:hypothetical protein
MGVTIKAINDALAALGEDVLLTKGNGYFYFDSGEATEWLDKTVHTTSLGRLTLDQWIEEFHRLKKLNRKLLSGGA